MCVFEQESESIGLGLLVEKQEIELVLKNSCVCPLQGE